MRTAFTAALLVGAAHSAAVAVAAADSTANAPPADAAPPAEVALAASEADASAATQPIAQPAAQPTAAELTPASDAAAADPLAAAAAEAEAAALSADDAAPRLRRPRSQADDGSAKRSEPRVRPSDKEHALLDRAEKPGGGGGGGGHGQLHRPHHVERSAERERWEEHPSDEEMPASSSATLYGAFRRVLLLASWLLAPCCGLLLFVCGVRCWAALDDDFPARGFLERSRLLTRRHKESLRLSHPYLGEKSPERQGRAQRRRRRAQNFAELIRVMLVVYPTVGRLVPQRLKEWTEAMLPVVSDDGPDGGVEMQSPTPLQAATHAASSAPASPNLCRRAATSTSGGSGGHTNLQVVTPAPQQLPLPALIGATTTPKCILSDAHRTEILRHLPPSLALCDWTLRYSTEQHGCSLRTALMRLDGRGPSLLAVLDSNGHLFGGFASESWHVSRHYFGTGESFLYEAHPTLRVYPWSGANPHFLLAFPDSIAFGGGGQFGLWLDEAFEYGSSGRSSTFGNEPLTTAAKPRLGDDDSTAAEFRVMRAEFWGFEAASPRGYATEMEIPDTEYDEDDVHARGMGGATPGVSRTPSLVTCDQSTIGRVCSSGVLNAMTAASNAGGLLRNVLSPKGRFGG